jgi:pyruvate/2-oxoglutarate dehydrogenase complex dihydrolipoamide dehydrogenase (E3) component
VPILTPRMQQTIEVDALVIGVGEAGALVASLAVDAGARVGLVYRDPWGSTCLNAGCVPSKFLIHRARVAHVVRTASRFGVRNGAPDVDLAGIVEEKRRYLDHHRDESWQGALREERLTLLEGSAEFVSPDRVRVGDRVVRSDRIFLALGMRPSVPEVDGVHDGPWLTNETVMDLEEVPGHLIVIGGGYIGCELGQAFRRFGAEVSIVQRAPRLLPVEEPDASTVVERAFREEGIDVFTGHRLRSVRWADGRPTVDVSDLDGASRSLEGTHLLLASGRTPNTDTLAPERAAVELDPRGFVRVDDELRTTAAGIWAIGDVNGLQPFTRVCQEEAKIAFANAFHDAGLRMRRESLPHAVFTDPEVGSVGLTERTAREQGHDVIAGLVPFGRIEKAELIGETEGFIKYIADRDTHRLLGCHVVGYQAADLVYDAVVVMRAEGLIDDLALAVGVFPTLQEGMEGVARAVLRKAAPEEVSGPLVTAVHRGIEGGGD